MTKMCSGKKKTNIYSLGFVFVWTVFASENSHAVPEFPLYYFQVQRVQTNHKAHVSRNKLKTLCCSLSQHFCPGNEFKKKNRNPLELQELKGAFEEKLTFQALLHVKKDFQEVQCLLRNEEVVLQGEIKEPKFPVDADLRDKVPA